MKFNNQLTQPADLNILPLNYSDRHSYHINFFTYNRDELNTHRNFHLFSRIETNLYSRQLVDEVSTDTFLFRRQSSIKAFFTSQTVDVPVCFRKSKSLYSSIFEKPMLKFNNLIMRSGNRDVI